MTIPALASSASRIAGLLAILIMATPAQAASAARARLVHCGDETCLRIAGHRSGPAVAIRIGGQDLAVEGGRAWHVTVPLTTARTWPTSLDHVILTSIDTQTGTESTQMVELPPGALGRRMELASLVVRAH